MGPRRRRLHEGCLFPVEVLSGTAAELLFPDNGFDVVVSSLVLCSVSDVDRAAAEMRRGLKPGGELRFYEHVRSERTKFARVQRALDVLRPVRGGGCHLSRDPESAMIGAGLRVETVRRFELTINGRISPSSLCVIGPCHQGMCIGWFTVGGWLWRQNHKQGRCSRVTGRAESHQERKEWHCYGSGSDAPPECGMRFPAGPEEALYAHRYAVPPAAKAPFGA